MRKLSITALFIAAILISCQEQKSNGIATKTIERNKPNTNTFHIESAKQWLETNAADVAKHQIAFAVNRTDSSHFAKMDSVIIPDDISGDLLFYLPFPLSVDYIKEVEKIIFFSYPSQTFATYEKGLLTYTGPTNMGRKNDPTSTGLFFTNWKAEKTISTVNDEWELLWNFNIANKDGIGWHQYEMPGYPASHSCLRLQEKDAKYLYAWADEWVLANKDSVQIKGTPVIVFGSFNFDAPKPWQQLVSNPKSLDISENEIHQVTAPHLKEILDEQQKRIGFKQQTSLK
jgi:lipoprotein-anchoring transpeptidase ErfK/SrfK